MDQASGLRIRMRERSETRGQSVKKRSFPPVPLIKVHLRLPGSDALAIPANSLVWHWHSVPRAATGWDLQARLHVCGRPSQFRAIELSQWRYLCEEWHLLGKSPEPLAVADIVVLWLPSSGAPALLPPLRMWLHWLCRNQPPIPIILAGITAAIGRRLTRWATAAGVIPEDYPLVPQEDEAERLALPRQRGYYRLLQMCRDHPAQTELQPDSTSMEVWR